MVRTMTWTAKPDHIERFIIAIVMMCLGFALPATFRATDGANQSRCDKGISYFVPSLISFRKLRAMLGRILSSLLQGSLGIRRSISRLMRLGLLRVFGIPCAMIGVNAFPICFRPFNGESINLLLIGEVVLAAILLPFLFGPCHSLDIT